MATPPTQAQDDLEGQRAGPRRPSTVAALRQLTPKRHLTETDARAVAERQAQRLLALHDITGPPVPNQLIIGLPRVEVVQEANMPVSGTTVWHGSRWLIVLNASDAPNRRRFTLFHEIKHVLDHPFGEGLYGGEGDPGCFTRTERICDYFAACALMPRPWVKRAWHQRIQSLPALAQLFSVSVPAMVTRLEALGLGESLTGRYRRAWADDPLAAFRRYHVKRPRVRRYWRCPPRTPTDTLSLPSLAVTDRAAVLASVMEG